MLFRSSEHLLAMAAVLLKRGGQKAAVPSSARSPGYVGFSYFPNEAIEITLMPHYKNFNKRLIKAPKIYFYDTGLVCSPLNIKSPGMLRTHYLYGSLFENFVISEVIKMQHHAGQKPTVYYWRDNNGVEIDCIAEDNTGRIHALEIKGGATISSDYIKNLKLFPVKSETISKKVIYTGIDDISIKDATITGFKSLEKTIKAIILPV